MCYILSADTADLAQSKRDDLEALGYMMVYFLRGSLPWQGLKTKCRQDKYRQVLAVKQQTTTEELCQGLPSAFVTYFRYLQSLRPDSCPDYRYLRQLFRRLMRQEDFEHDHVYDWTVIEFQRLHGETSGTPRQDESNNNNNSGSSSNIST